MRVAVVHDWLTVMGGAERVLAEILRLYPDADLLTLVDFLPDGHRAFLGRRPVGTSFIQRLPFARRHYRNYLPLMPIAIEQFDLSRYELVISSSFAVAKGVITGPDQIHVSYVHSPMRYAWDLMHEYLADPAMEGRIKALAFRWVLHRVRMWDVRTANGVDSFVANSRFVARRIGKVYARPATVIYPPVDISRMTPRRQKDDFYLTVSRLVPYKRIDVLVDAFARRPDERLVVVGDGPQRAALAARAGANVQFTGRVKDEDVVALMQRAKAFIFAGVEDFGIAMVEAQACGTPVILFNKGGGVETVRGLSQPRPTGILFSEQTPQAILSALDEFEERGRAIILPENCRANAESFSAERFRREFHQIVDREIERRQRTLAADNEPFVVRPAYAAANTDERAKVEP